MWRTSTEQRPRALARRRQSRRAERRVRVCPAACLQPACALWHGSLCRVAGLTWGLVEVHTICPRSCCIDEAARVGGTARWAESRCCRVCDPGVRSGTYYLGSFPSFSPRVLQ